MLGELAAAWDRPRIVVGVLVFAPEVQGMTAALAAAAAGIPVVWATSEVNYGYLERESLGPLEVRLDAGVQDLFRGLRSLMLATHWHTFTLIYTGLPLRKDVADVISTPPLQPKFIPLRPDAARQAIFRMLSDVSHLTKGVVVMMSDSAAAKRVMDEAKRLHMVQGNFVWLWIDTGSSLTARNESKLNIFYPLDDRIKDRRARESGDHHDTSSSEDYFNNLIKQLGSANSTNSTSDTGRELNTRTNETGLVNNSNINNNEINLDNRTEVNDKINKLDRVSESSLSSKNTSVSHDYIWISNERVTVFSKDKTSEPFPLHVFENSTTSDSFNTTASNNSDRTLRVRRSAKELDMVPPLPVGVLGVRALPLRFDRHLVRSAVRLVVDALKRALHRKCHVDVQEGRQTPSCRDPSPSWQKDFSQYLVRELKAEPEQVNASSEKTDRVLAPRFQILNLVPDSPQVVQEDFEMRVVQESTTWRPVGDIVGQNVHLDTVVWPGGDLVPVSTSRGVRSVFRVVTSLAPPFVMEGELDEDGQCLRGLECHRLLTSDKDNLTLVFNEMERMEDAEEDELPERDVWAMGSIFQNSRYKYRTNCCYGLSMDLLENVAQELEFDFHLYIVADEAYGSRVVQSDGEVKWNGIVGDLVSGAAHMSFSALSVSSPRSQVIDFSVPYFFSGVSFLAAPRQRTDIPLLAFLLPFSPELWIAIFTSLNVTAVAVAIYEWLSPFGLNPWGRQRSKNFSMSSALWVCWGLLCGHLVAFKAPKSWPNKFLINVWGGFSVIFVASYTANIAALIAGLFFHNAVGDYHDRSLLSQRVGTPRASAADYYVHRANQVLWEHMQRYSVKDVATGVQHLKNGSLDILIADTPILDYYRATDHGCKLQKIGDAINEDTYAVGMTKGFPLKDSISAVIAKYSSNGYMDILQEKWYGGLPCFKLATDMAQPRPLGVAAVTGVFLLLGMGMVVGCLILLIEHLFYRYTLPILRHKPKGTIWRSRNIMFFSQKLYRFINCVELVSPHHAARELVHTLRQGQITSLFQKSVKRKEHEQRRRRRSKAQFFEMIQEIRRVQQEEKVVNATVPMLTLPEEKSPKVKKHTPEQRRHSRLNLVRRLSKDVFRSKSSSNLSIRRLSSDINMAAGRFLDCHSSQAIGRRLSRDTNLSPPDINSRRASHLSINRKPSSQFLSPSDAESSSDVSMTPRSPNLINTQSTSMRLLQTLPKSPDYASAASRFRYVDIKSPSFKTKLSRFKEPQEETPKVVIHCDTEIPTTSTAPPTPPPRTTSASTASQEHLIEIIIPPDNTPVASDRLTSGETLQPSRSLIGLSVLEQISSLEQTPRPPTAPKPKIVSYLPKKHRKLSTEAGQRKVNSKPRKRASSDSILRAEEPNPETCDMSVVENCDVFLPESTPLSRLSRAELMTLSQIPEHELKRKLMEAIENRDPT
ncbi:uncharacterized protein LOC128994876 isoform X1 [Macrosteles quadrilineatus]|uniref:uncharacterized protein LOC128994876 isoform X1 n=1 Tax=Macrosteles quadrilineatus TaxID=74068 RepID=UPI0023E09DFA|nr:uncharacterized protein LOC128994876 isoform X1 [Macrosteles quadrilineatus]